MPTQISCHGCSRLFSVHGLSIHVSKSPDPRCRVVPSASRVRAVSTAIQNTTTPPPLNQNCASPIPEDNVLSGEFEQASDAGMSEDDTAAWTDISIDPPDAADVADANTLEDISFDTSAVPPLDQLNNGTAPEADQTNLGDQADVPESVSIPTVVIERFPFGSPGAPIPGGAQDTSTFASQQAIFTDSPWGPFQSQLDWDIARWAKLRGPTSTAVSELLAIPGVVDGLGLSFTSISGLNKILDTELQGRPSFQTEEFILGDELQEFYFRDIVQCVRALYGDLEFADHLVFAPERHYTSEERTCRIYNEMHTGDWWWTVQDSLEHRQPGATVVPLIVSTDKTQLTHFRDKMAYPIYLTIGNITKGIRRKVTRQAQILIGYIPTTKLSRIRGVTARRRALTNLFHACMQKVLSPITAYGETGIEMKSGDGVWRRCHPIIAVFAGDYPEQALVTCTYYGQCPKCKVPRDKLGEYETFPRRMQSEVIDTYQLCDGDAQIFNHACQEIRMKPVFHPFWAKLPLTDIFLSVTPDILHQMLQGMVKHLIRWLTRIYGGALIDSRCRMMPPNHKVMLFTKGISTLSRVSGHEHKKMCSILLGLIVDLPVPGGLHSTRIIRVVRALMDFLFLARYESHTSDTISLLQECLVTFHENKEVFIDLQVRKDFNLPKLHSLSHYASAIRLFGTTDNYNTEQTERLHIDLAKDAYRATNHKDEYVQMTRWLERREKVLRHSAFITQRQQGYPDRLPSQNVIGPPRTCALKVRMPLNPERRQASFDDLAQHYGALDFQDALADFIVQVNHPHMSMTAQRDRAHNTHIPFSHVPVYHKIKFTKSGDFNETEIIADSVHIRPELKDSRGRTIPARFDTVLVQSSKGYRIAQVRVVFKIPSKNIDELIPTSDTTPPNHLAYVEWFSPIPAMPDPKYLMYKVSRVVRNGRRSASIIPVDLLLCSVHLLPQFGAAEPGEWNTFTALDLCQTFYINPFTDIYSYLTFG